MRDRACTPARPACVDGRDVARAWRKRLRCRAMKIYTRTGDDGSTGLYGGSRVSKASLRVEAYGTVDEANSAIGRARASLANGPAASIEAVLAEAQVDLFTLGAELACAPDKSAKPTPDKESTSGGAKSKDGSTEIAPEPKAPTPKPPAKPHRTHSR